MTQINSLKFALDMEKKGAIFYLDFAMKSTDPITKKLFYSLSAQEIGHAKIVDEIAELNKEINKKSKIELSPNNDIEKEMKKFFKDVKKQYLKISKSQEKGYETAMELERKSYKIYKALLEDSKKDSDKSFFKALMEQEDEHMEALKNVYNYLTKNAEWFEEGENKVWNWMNL